MRMSSRLHRLGHDAGHAVFRNRDALVPLAVLVLAACSRREDFLAPPALDPWLDALGLVGILAGLAIRALVLGTSGIRRSGVRRRVVAEILHDSGPYAWCRNPLYLGNATILVGLSFVFDSRWMVGVAVPAALLGIWSIVLAEERMLRETFGARYRDYCDRVPRFLPRMPRTEDDGTRRVDWRRALRKEHGTIFSAATAAALLALAEDHVRTGFAHRHTLLIVGTWLGTALSWTIVRFLKRQGRLADTYIDTTAASSSTHYPDAAA